MKIDHRDVHLEDTGGLHVGLDAAERGAGAGPRRGGITVVLGGCLGGVLPDELVGRFLVGDQEGQFRQRGFQLGADGAVGTDRGGDLHLDLGLGRQAGKFNQQLLVDANLFRRLQAGRELLGRVLGRVMRFGQ